MRGRQYIRLRVSITCLARKMVPLLYGARDGRELLETPCTFPPVRWLPLTKVVWSNEIVSMKQIQRVLKGQVAGVWSLGFPEVRQSSDLCTNVQGGGGGVGG